MNEKLIFESIEVALSGAQNAEGSLYNLIEDLNDGERNGEPGQFLNPGMVREALEHLSGIVDNIETILFDLTKIHEEHGRIEARLSQIEEASGHIFKSNSFILRPEGIEKEIPFN